VRGRNLLEVAWQRGLCGGLTAARGFIAPNDGGDDVYAHYSAIETQGYKYLEEGQKVEFDILMGPDGLQATNIRTLG